MTKKAAIMDKANLWVKLDTIMISPVQRKQDDVNDQHDIVTLKKYDKKLQELLARGEYKHF